MAQGALVLLSIVVLAGGFCVLFTRMGLPPEPQQIKLKLNPLNHPLSWENIFGLAIVPRCILALIAVLFAAPYCR